MYSTCERSHRVKSHGHEPSGDPGSGGFIRACTVDHHLTAAPTLFSILKQYLESDCPGDHAVAHAACARARVDNEHRRALFSQTIQFLDANAGHAELSEELVSPPQLECNKRGQ
jgi:hypothetical protein